jgi:uncharacterized protein YukE
VQQNRLQALEHALDQMATRVALAEIMAGRQAQAACQWEKRARKAEDALIRLQDNLDHARRSTREA